MTYQTTGQRACHVQIRDIAMAAANEFYDKRMSDNKNYELWKKMHPGMTDKRLRQIFVTKYWPHCIQFARHTLVMMLERPDITEAMKDRIMEVLEQDQHLRTTLPMAPGVH